MPVSALPAAMIELSFRASLMAAVGAAALSVPGFQATILAAVTLAAVTIPADPEDCVASDRRTNALTEDHLAMPIHVRRKAGLDNGDRSWQVRTSLLWWLPDEGCQTGRPDRADGPGTRCVPALDEELYQVPRWMIDG